jgi:hypothetical protein
VSFFASGVKGRFEMRAGRAALPVQNCRIGDAHLQAE